MGLQKDSPRVWFISGCSSGLGRALAKRVLAHGYRAVVTARDVHHISDIVASHPATSLGLALDVTQTESVTQAVAHAESMFGSIDVLVNNAGYGYLAAVEEGEDDEIRAVFETNFFGLASLIRQVLPGMRRRASGHIVNITSVGGLLGNPGSGYYNATKFAVEGLSEALAKEVTDLGIHVTTVEPGPFRTDWAGRSLKRARVPLPAYAQTVAARHAELVRNSGKQPGDPERAAEALIRVVECHHAPQKLVLGKNALARVRAKLSALEKELQEWESITVGADFPES